MQVGHGGAEESLLESYKSTNLPHCTANLSALLPHPYKCDPDRCRGAIQCLCRCASVCTGLCFCMLCRWLLAHGCVRLKLPANYSLNASISREQTGSAARVSLGHYHRLSCSLKPEVTTALSVCTACRVLSSACGMEGNRSSPVISI